MKLHAKVIVLLIALFAAYGAIDYTVQQRVILPSFESLEADLARTDMQRASHALDGETSALRVFCADWANWLDTYQFMQTHHMRFIEENMTPATIEAANLNLVAFLDKDSRVAWSKGYDTRDFSEANYRLLDGGRLEANSPFRDFIARGKETSGLVQTEHGPMIVVVAPILNGAGEGPQRGAVLLGRVITPKLVKKLARQAEVDLKMITPAQSQPAGNDPDAISMVTRETVNEVYRNVLDTAGKPALTFRVDVPRSITERGVKAIHYALASLLIAGVVVLFVLLWALRRLILRPVTRMTRHAVSIGESDDLTHRLGVRRSDELGILAREFDRMVDRFADARRRLVDKSFEAGVAEMASGVLHNVGNALTPIAVRTASIQSTLADLPAADLQMVLKELENGVVDASRRKDLQEFLRLASTETMNANLKVAGDIKAIADSVLAIQAMLNDRAQYARSGPVIELVRLDDVVREALRLVPPQRLAAVEVIVEDSVAAIGTVQLARVTMQQVFQNLIVNACEATRSGAQGRIRVSARATGADGERQLKVTFSDNGTGIAPEHLSTIFNKGFSTKPLENNSGLGLHWSANIVASLNGRIYAESPGTDGGAEFHVVLPLHKTAYDPGAIAA
jgi:two-component system NtrC family sensor kinase